MLVANKENEVFVRIYEIMKQEFPELELEKTSWDIKYLLYYQSIVDELEKAKKFPPFASLHEGYAVLKEEVEEFWYEVKLQKYDDSHEALARLDRTEKELIQIAAVVIKNLQLVETMKAKIQEAKG
jgi:hypothetical protein